jgi:hypothetical protein
MNRRKEKMESGYKVDKGIEMPSLGRSTCPYPFDKLQIGDSFFVPIDGKVENKVRSSAYHFARVWDVKIKIRLMHENGVWGLRVWRVKMPKK